MPDALKYTSRHGHAAAVPIGSPNVACLPFFILDRLLHNYVKFRLDHPDFFKEMTRAEFEAAMASKAQGILPGRDMYAGPADAAFTHGSRTYHRPPLGATLLSHGCVVLVIIMSRMNDANINFVSQMRAASWMMEIVRPAPTVAAGAPAY